jgi:DNA (cytosine-5)-methyltransferase 1
MRYLSVCSGIEAATVAWHPLGWEAAAYSEIEKFPSQVLAHHYPNTPNVGDMTKFKEWTNVSDVDVLVGGTPCQSFSVAGLRKGLDDPRGNLMLTYLAIAAKYRPKWLVWENVPGVLSSNGGLDFASLLRGMGELGYGFAYRVLDAQYFGVAQRRRRVFVVGYAGNWRPAAAVLFERHSMCGYPAPSREKRKGVAASTSCGLVGGVDYENNAHGADDPTGPLLKGSPTGGGRPLPAIITMAHGQGGAEIATDRSPTLTCNHEAPIAAYPVYELHSQDSRVRELGDVCTTVSATYGSGGGNVPITLAQPIALAENTIGRKPENGGNHDGFTEGGPMYTLNATGVHGVAQPIAYALDSLASNSMKSANPASGCNAVDVSKALDTSRGLDPSCNQGGMAVAQPTTFALDEYNQTGHKEVCYPLRTASGDGIPKVNLSSMAVRRLTPVECERLQGFPDNYTDIKLKGKPTPDGPRYKALGNSMAVPVMAWIGKRIQEVEAINAP